MPLTDKNTKNIAKTINPISLNITNTLNYAKVF